MKIKKEKRKLILLGWPESLFMFFRGSDFSILFIGQPNI